MMPTPSAAAAPTRLLAVGLVVAFAAVASAQEAPPSEPAAADSATAEEAPAETAPAKAAPAEAPSEAAPAAEAPAEEVPPEPPKDPAQLEAEAKDAMRAGDCENAAPLFSAFADAIEADSARTEEQLTARFLAGVCYERLDRLQEAADALRAVVYGDAPPALIEKAEPLLQGIEPLLPVAVTFVCEEDDVTITLAAYPDDARSCAQPWSLPSGKYRGAASATDGREVPLLVTVTPGVPEEVVVLLPAASGETRNTIVEEAPPPPPPGDTLLLEWALSSAAVASLGAGIAFNVVARSAVERGDEAYARYERARAVYDVATAAAARVEVEDAREDADTAAITSYVFLGTGVALAGVATWLWLDETTVSADARAVRLVPTLDGIGVVGRW